MDFKLTSAAYGSEHVRANAWDTRQHYVRACYPSQTYLLPCGIPYNSSPPPSATISHPPQPGLGPLGPSTDLNKVETRAGENNPGAGAGACAPNNDALDPLLGVPIIGATSARAVSCACCIL